MPRITLTVAAVAALLTSAGAARAQTYGQIHVRAPAVTYGQPYGGATSELNARAYAQTGRYATGYSDGYSSYGGYGGTPYGDPYAYRPPAYGYNYGYGGYGYDRGGRYGYSHSRYQGRPAPGYRDRYGYNDDRAPTYSGSYSRSYDRRYCGCSDVYLYDR